MPEIIPEVLEVAPGVPGGGTPEATEIIQEVPETIQEVPEIVPEVLEVAPGVPGGGTPEATEIIQEVPEIIQEAPEIIQEVLVVNPGVPGGGTPEIARRCREMALRRSPGSPGGAGRWHPGDHPEVALEIKAGACCGRGFCVRGSPSRRGNEVPEEPSPGGACRHG